jgi:kynureninase
LGITRDDAEALDAQDSLASLREQFSIVPGTELYMDGNSLGRPPSSAAELVTTALRAWHEDLILAWRDWIKLPRRLGDDLAAHVLDASTGEVIVSDSTTVNLYKTASAAVDLRPGRRGIVTSDDNFPTDIYVLQALAAQRDLQLTVLPADPVHGLAAETLSAALSDDTALVCLSHVAYRSAAMLDLLATTALVHQAGALMLWDLCHSAGAVPVHLTDSAADLAVGCTYKYLNGGPGAPAFAYVRTDLQPQLRQPIWGWFGHRKQFAMAAEFEPADGIERMLAGAPSILSTVAIQAGLAATAAAGVDRLYVKAQQLTELIIELADQWLTPLGFAVVSPRDAAHRGAHISLRHAEAKSMVRGLIAAGVTPDYRPTDQVRIGPAPLYTRFVDVWDAMERLRQVASAQQ